MSERVTADTWQHNGRQVEVGDEMSVQGERGRFRFVEHVLTDAEESITVYGGTDGAQAFRSFRPERVTVIHRKGKLRAAGMPKARDLGRIRP